MSKKYEVLGRDFNSPLARNYIWVMCCQWYPSLIGIKPLDTIIVSRNNTIVYADKLSRTSEMHQQLRNKVERDPRFLIKLITTTEKCSKEFVLWCKNNFQSQQLQKASSEELWLLWEKFAQLNSELYTLGVALPLMDFEDYKLIENTLERVLREKFSNLKNRQKAYQLLTHPAYLSYAAEQELALWDLMHKFYNSAKWRRDVEIMSQEDLARHYPMFWTALRRHAKKFAWVYYVYTGPAYTPGNFLEFIRENLRQKIAPKRVIYKMRQRNLSIAKEKRLLLRKMNLKGSDKLLIEFASVMVWAKPRRKDYQSQGYNLLQKWQEEVGRRLLLSLSQVRSLPPVALHQALQGKRKDWAALSKKAERLHVCVSTKNGVKVLIGKTAENFIHQHLREEKTQIANTKKLQGTCAYPGIVKGRVCIINRPQDMLRMKHGEILVSIATTPSIVPAMKKAAAIITDEGGSTCHASIVSREMGTPCIVGTGFATKLLKNGDRILLDANKGIVEKL